MNPFIQNLQNHWDELPTIFGKRWKEVEPRFLSLLETAQNPRTNQQDLILKLMTLLHSAGKRGENFIQKLQVNAFKDAEEASVTSGPARSGGFEAQIGDFDTETVFNYTIVPVFYATDRQIIGKAAPQDFYGGKRGNGTLSYGKLEVSIPNDHKLGNLEAPKWWKFEFKQDPEKHVVLIKVETLERSKFNEEARQALAAATKNEALVFIHGYNVTFENAARRAAQVAYDLKFEGVPMLYSWASAGTLAGYFMDGENIVLTKPLLQTFVKQVMTELGAETVHLIAHSMGNRALTEVLADLDMQSLPPTAAHLHQVIFAAPDVNAQNFQELAAKFSEKASRYTLYTTNEDRALQASALIHGGKRAGNTNLVVEGVDTIDASEVTDSVLGLNHSYFGNKSSLIGDIYHLINENKPPEKRGGLQKILENEFLFWKILAP